MVNMVQQMTQTLVLVTPLQALSPHQTELSASSVI